MRLSVNDGEETFDITVEEFTLKVLLAQGVETESEATKKALAVAIRSCGANISINGCKHKDFDICTDINCCFPFGKEEDFDKEYVEQCRKAVLETRNEILVYENEPIMALQSACASLGTQKCKEYPYLSAVPEKDVCQKHSYSLWLKTKELGEMLEMENLKLETLRQESCLAYGDNKKCEFAVIGGKAFFQLELMERLSLESPEFYIYYTFDGARIQGNGLGNGYGLNLCGAEKLAKDGEDYKEILKHYFPKCNLSQY